MHDLRRARKRSIKSVGANMGSNSPRVHQKEKEDAIGILFLFLPADFALLQTTNKIFPSP